jgi:two-component system, cell cycle response regulator
LGLLIFDLDFFKTVNDTYGHIVGDRVLLAISNTTKECLREGDIFIRYGGEEFLVVIPGASSSDLLQIAENIRHRIEDSTISHHSQTIRVTISLGGVSFPEHPANNIQTLIDTADKKLYQAKASGRNRTIMA